MALSRLWFILALATLYVTAQGDAVVAMGRRRWIDTHWFRGNSYFRIGWEWVKAAFSKGWELISTVCLRVITILTLRWPLASKMKSGVIDLSFRFTRLSMRPSDDSKSYSGKGFRLLDSSFVSQPGLAMQLKIGCSIRFMTD